MGWAFWRRNNEKAGGDSPGSAERETDTDPAAELRVRTRRRLIGAASLLLAAAFVLPMFLDSAPRPVSDAVTITVRGESQPVNSPPQPAPTVPVASVDSAPAETRVEAAPAEQKAKAATVTPEPTRATAEAEKFALQVAALSSVGAANQLVARLKKAGFVAYVEPIKTAEGPRHRVRVGPFLSRDDAQRISEKLRAAGFAAALVSA